MLLCVPASQKDGNLLHQKAPLLRWIRMALMQARMMHVRLASSLQLGHVPCTKPVCAIQRMPSLVSQVSQNPVTRTIGTGVVAMVAVKNTSFASKSQARTWILLVIRSTPTISNVQICELA